jgi:nitrite reductase (NO-forming)
MMQMDRYYQKYWLSVLALVMVVLASACAGTVEAQVSGHSATQADPPHGQLTRGSASDLGEPTVRYALRTDIVDGKMAFVGMEGDLEGQVNPDLQAQPGDVVEIRLVNGDGAMHDLAIEELGIATEQIAGQDKETSLIFKVDEQGSYTYFCSVPGHRQAGMVGRLVVGEVVQQAEVTTSVVRGADDLPGPVDRSASEHVRVDLETVEVEARLSDGSSFVYWTFNGKVPGPFIRVRVGDTVEVHLKNAADSLMNHSVDFHAVTGPGGGAVATQTKPGEETTFTFKALNPGLYVYHCATPMVAHHIANGMYGLILVEPEEGLAVVDREFYVMQGEVYTTEDLGAQGLQTFSVEKLLDEQPEYFVLNGAVGALTAESPLKANVGETVRIFFGVGGPNFTSSFHVIGEIFDRVYDQGSLTSAPLTNVQTTLVPPGGAAMVEFGLEVPGRYILVDHALSRLERGLAGFLLVEGADNPEVYEGQPTEGSGH